MIQNLYDIFELEQCLKQEDNKQFLTLFKKAIRANPESKIPLTDNPGLTIYTPSKTKNLKTSKNILLLIHELSRTGAPVVATDAAKILVKNGFFVTVVTMHRGPLLKELLDTGIPVVLDRELALLQDSKALLATKNNYLYIDTFLSSFDKTLIITAVYYNLVKRYANTTTPIIWWLHEGSATYDNLGQSMPRQLSSSIHVYAGGKYALDQLEYYGLPYSAKILNYGVADVPQSPSQLDNKVVKFILPGSLGKRKGQKTLIEAIQKLPKSYQQYSEFIFIGDILSEADIDGKTVKTSLLKLSKSLPNVVYYPSVSRDELFKIYQKINVLVLPSIDDPMPVVATEALMLEKIILCSTTTGTSYYLKNGENGFIFETKDTADLCKKIQYIIDHRQHLSSIGKKGRIVYEKNFKMDIFEKNLMNVIKEEV